MLIKDMFARNIEREIKNVITVGKDEDSAFEQQELEEYVVTKELQKHFSDFFAAYKKGITGTTPKMGVWISGFFGSGKSHFLKMLYFLLSNKTVNGKTALEYFKEDNKIADPLVMADIELAANPRTPTDAILFNIDAKNSANSKQDKDAIVKVFQKVFNEMQGYYGEIPKLAELEHHLDEEGRYDEFKQKFLEKKGLTWEENRHDLYFNQDIIVKILVEMGIMSEEAARNWCAGATSTKGDTISIEQFAKRVAAYIESKGANHHVVFLVDEVGQYIGNDSKLMLNLQTVTEELGKACKGKAWVIVTSQQDIDSVTHVKGNDFSKIQGRFDTRLSLSSANVDEVIKERILKKRKAANELLELVYEDKETALKNLISFTGTAEKKLYRNKKDFADVYPFVGYQFDLLGSVLTEVRQHGASGKSLAEGERSMLSFFKEAARVYKDQDDMTLIPFNAFYNPLDNYLDHSHRSVILKAYVNDHINPDKKSDVFAIEVLKALFMVKYVREIDANLDNITSLMVSNIQEERVVLREEVRKSLQLLENEMLIQRQGEIYIFLTNEEQEMNRRIAKQQIEPQEVTAKTAELIFNSIFTDKNYRYPALNGRYNFGVNQSVDDFIYRRNNELGIMIITAQSEFDAQESTMANLSMQNQCVVVRLKDRDDYYNELLMELKIESFIKKDSEAKALAQYEEIRIRKGNEAKDRRNIALHLLEDALQEADIYICGNKVDIAAKAPAKRLDEALENLAKRTFTKLPYITKPMEMTDVKTALQESDSHNIDLFAGGGEANQQALNDMLMYISDKAGMHGKISLKLVKDHFEHRPYGFIDEDVFYLVARLFRRGDISFTMNGQYVTLSNTIANDLYSYITKKTFVEKLMIEKRERVSDQEKKTVRLIMKDMFSDSTQTDDEDELMNVFKEHAQKMLSRLSGIDGQLKNPTAIYTLRYPGEDVVKTGIQLLNGICETKTAAEFFRTTSKAEDDLLDFNEDFENVNKFFDEEGKQKGCFDEAVRTYKIYKESQNYLVSEAIDRIAAEIWDILSNKKPYRQIKDLPDLREKFNDAYEEVLTEKAGPVRAKIEDCKNRVLDELAGRPYEKEKIGKFNSKFDELLQAVDTSNNINRLMSLGNQAEAVRDKFLNEIAAAEAKLPVEPSGKEVTDSSKHDEYSPETGTKPVEPPVKPKPVTKKKTKYVHIKDVAGFVSIEIHNEEGLDKFLQIVKKKIMGDLQDLDSIHIEF